MASHAPPEPRLEAHPHPKPGLRLSAACAGSAASASPRAVLAWQVASEQIEAVRELAGDAVAEEVGAVINKDAGELFGVIRAVSMLRAVPPYYLGCR